MIRIIYLDIDGTLRDERTGLSPGAGEALRRCREKGISVVICTGRNPASIQEDVREMETDGLIAGGGCYIRCQGRLLQAVHFPEETVESCLSLAAGKAGISLESEHEIYMNDRAVRFYQEDLSRKLSGADKRERERFLRENKICYRDNLSLLGESPRGIHKICLAGEKEDLNRLKGRLKGRWELVQERDWNGKWYLEALPAGQGKGWAVRSLNRYLGIRREETMGFGDGLNDMELLREAGVGVAVDGGDERLKAMADFVCEPPGEGGIKKELVRQGLIEAF